MHVFDPDSDFVLFCKATVVHILYGLGRLEETKTPGTETYESCKVNLGPEHPVTSSVRPRWS
jgi:hypothetical protein